MKILLISILLTGGPGVAQPTIDTSRFVLIPAGEYRLGQENHQSNPKHVAKLNSFYISKYEVTNAEFAAFVKATGYVTVAEIAHNAMVFEPPLAEFEWKEDSTANWRFPNGIRHGGIEQKMDHPVTTICFKDIMAYCDWAGVRLPTLDEWEAASRGGSERKYFFGKKVNRIAQFANIWHGKDHRQKDTGDPYMYTSPVGSFAPNAQGLYDVYGNVFEYCGDLTRETRDKVGTAMARGGSWWCSSNACGFFNSVDIGRNDKMASFSNQGFRVVLTDNAKR
jgi:formylglycine-generating enzyme